MTNNEQFASVIHGLFASIIQSAGVSLPSPDRIEEMRRTSATLALMLSDKVKEEAVVLIKLLQDATNEGFENLEQEVRFLQKTVEDLQNDVGAVQKKMRSQEPARHQP